MLSCLVYFYVSSKCLVCVMFFDYVYGSSCLVHMVIVCVRVVILSVFAVLSIHILI
jgi:hypothetical protein